jgi:hypothetical protein
MLVNKSKLGVLTLIIVLLSSYTVAIAAAQYTTEKTTDIAIASDGTFVAFESDAGVSYVIHGTPGATGSVTAGVYSSNPQPTATVPDGISLGHFVVITFDMNADDFGSATITLTYSDSDVSGISTPYSIYKYDADTNSYTALQSIEDATAKTITVTVISIADPLFAIGGTASEGLSNEGFSATSWAILVVAVIVIVVLVVFAFTRLRTRVER